MKKDEKIETHMNERGKLIIYVLFYYIYLFIFRINTLGAFKRLV